MTTRYYKINGVYNTWQYWHDNCGYSTSPSQPMSFKKSDAEHWGENAGDGYVLNSDSEFLLWSMWSDGIVGWFDADDMAVNGAYPASSVDVLLERTGEQARAVSFNDGTNTYYLIDGYLSLGWRLWDALEADGWQVSAGGVISFIVVDETTGQIVYSISETEENPGMVFSQVGHIEMPDSGMITVYETGVQTESFYFTTNGRNETANTNISFSDIPVYLEDGTAPAADTPYNGSSVLAFMDVEGNTKQADGESLYLDNGELRLDAPDTDEGEQWAALVERIFTLSFANTQLPGITITLPASETGTSGTTVTLPTMSGEYQSGGKTWSPTAWDIGAFGSTYTITGDVTAHLIFEEVPSELTAYFNSSKTEFGLSINSSYTLYDESGQRISYDSSKTYTIVSASSTSTAHPNWTQEELALLSLGSSGSYLSVITGSSIPYYNGIQSIKYTES